MKPIILRDPDTNKAYWVPDSNIAGWARVNELEGFVYLKYPVNLRTVLIYRGDTNDLL